ncbi:MAG: HAD hydrolase family protein [Chloroflexota bacterium]
MAESYRQITCALAQKIKLVMTDVDGTITSGDGSFTPEVVASIHSLEKQGITVGLVSGREINRLAQFAEQLNISGPLVAENGAVACLKKDGAPVDLGYSRKPALKAMEKLKGLFPDAIEVGENWNKSRMIDLLFRVHGVTAGELRKHLADADILDSGYVLHLVQKGVSKGGTLLRIIKMLANACLSPEEVMVFGDAPTDLSLFQSFPQSVLVINPDIPVAQGMMLREGARYISDACCGEGFAQVIAHLLSARNGTGSAQV